MDSLKYLKRKWDESRGDEFNYWGTSNWYFETSFKGEVIRQVEEYEIGIRLRYDKDKLEDRFGGLSEVDLDLNDKEFIEIGEKEFTKVWNERNPSLCQTIDDEEISIDELEKIEIDLPISDDMYDEFFSTGLINKLQYLPMKYGPIQDFEEAMILNEGLEEMIRILNKEKIGISENLQPEYGHIIEFIRQGKHGGKAIQFWL